MRSLKNAWSSSEINGWNSGPKFLCRSVGDEIQPFLQTITIVVPLAGARFLVGSLVGDDLDDSRAFGEKFAVVEHQGGDLALRIDRE